MLGSVSVGQGNDDLAMALLRVASDPEATKQRLEQLRAVQAGIDAARAALSNAQSVSIKLEEELVSREQEVARKEGLATAARNNQAAREKALRAKDDELTARKGEIALAERRNKSEAETLARQMAHVEAERRALEVERKELNDLKASYTAKLAKLSAIVGADHVA